MDFHYLCSGEWVPNAKYLGHPISLETAVTVPVSLPRSTTWHSVLTHSLNTEHLVSSRHCVGTRNTATALGSIQFD